MKLGLNIHWQAGSNGAKIDVAGHTGILEGSILFTSSPAGPTYGVYNNEIGSLPEGIELVGDEPQIFDVKTDGGQPTQIQINPNGDIFPLDNTVTSVNLNGVILTVKDNVPAEALELSSGFIPYGGIYEDPTIHIGHNDVIVLQGMIYNTDSATSTKDKVIATIPWKYREFRPNKVHLFQLNSAGGGMRVDVTPEGEIIARGDIGRWLSLSGLVYHIRGKGSVAVG